MKTKTAVIGGIGCGKSTVCMALKIMGFPVYDCDKNAKKITENNRDTIEKIKKLFGDDIYVNGSLDRKKVAAVVFSDHKKLEELNKIVHPAVIEDFEKWTQKQKSDTVFVETAILFESGMDKVVDKIMAVCAPEKMRIERVIARDKVSEEQALKRIAAQMSQQKITDAADYVVTADETEPVIPQLYKIIEELTKNESVLKTTD